MKLSVVITTKNAAQTLERTLKSVTFADEIVVVDMKSSDETLVIASKYTDAVFSTPDVGYVEPARNFSISKAKGSWILLVDADEVIPATLRDCIIKTTQIESPVACYFIARKNIIFGEWVEKAGWWPDHQPRLFLRGHVAWADKIHSKPVITGEVQYLPAQEELAITHYNYQSISQYVRRMNRYTTIAAREFVENQSPTRGPIDVFRRELLQRLFPLQGIDGGYRGVLLSFLQGFSEVVQTAKSWEFQQKEVVGTKSENLQALNELRAQMAYWIADERVKESNGLSALIWRVRRRFRF